jgi:hypothetical protein
MELTKTEIKILVRIRDRRVVGGFTTTNDDNDDERVDEGIQEEYLFDAGSSPLLDIEGAAIKYHCRDDTDVKGTRGGRDSVC